jgi:hypothetical protein
MDGWTQLSLCLSGSLSLCLSLSLFVSLSLFGLVLWCGLVVGVVLLCCVKHTERDVEAAVELESAKRLREALVRGQASCGAMKDMWDVLASLGLRTDDACKHWKLVQAVVRFTQLEVSCESWEESQAAIAGLEEKLSSMDAFTVARTCLMSQTVETTKSAITQVPFTALERTHAPITLLVDWLVAAVEVAEASLECRKAEKVAVEEKGDEYTKQVEDEVTDKPKEEAPPAEE